MNILYGKDKYFIGVLKFFDNIKDFGFIASNNCNMPTITYNQDFWVNSESFIEKEAIEEGLVVVFQVELQKSGKKRAVNVRRIKKNEDDIKLAMTYYGDHEYIEYKNNKKLNLYTHIYKPRKNVAEKVLSIIVNDKERSPEKTAQHFKFFIEHYPNTNGSYVFDYDFTREDKSVWVNFFDTLTEEENLEIIKRYPSTIFYFSNPNILQKWLDSTLKQGASLSQLQNFSEKIKLLPPDFADIAKERIASIADENIKILYEKLSKRTDVDESYLESSSHEKWTGMYLNEGNSIMQSIHSFLMLTPNEHEEEKRNCLIAVRYNKYKEALDKFILHPSRIELVEQLIISFNSLGEDKNKHFDELKKEILNVIDKNISANSYDYTVRLLEVTSPVIEDKLDEYIIRLFPLIKSHLSKYLTDNITEPYKIRQNFFSLFHRLTRLFNEKQIEEIKKSLRRQILQSKSIYILSFFSEDGEWLSMDESLKKVSEIVALWHYKDYKKFFEDNQVLFNNSCEFNNIIVQNALSLIGQYSLKQSFEGQNDECQDNDIIQFNNCSFLKELKSRVLLSSNNTKSAWDNYIKAKNGEDKLILYKHNIISDLPEDIISHIIYSISLDDVLADNNRWYYKPVLKDQQYIRILSNTTIDLFPIIASRLVELELTPENIPLAVLLSELMTINKPKDQDYVNKRNWENSFSLKLNELKNANSTNNKLVIILWATHFVSSASIAGLKETFSLLPPYLQIRGTKKLFQLIAQGKIQHTAESLYNLLCSDTKPICFPLEIAFAYLIRREKDPDATLDQNIMLHLIDGRDDHPEWIGIRQLITECHGRVEARELQDNRNNPWRGKFFNGIIEEGKDNKLIVFVPNKMINEEGLVQDYNNVFFNKIQELIKISYNVSDYQVKNVQQGVEYYFDKSYEIDLFAIARAYRLKYKGFNNYVDFNIKEKEDDIFCECNIADAIDNWHSLSFFWCCNKLCFRQPIRYMLDSEWENYTILDFMRILHIPTDYTNLTGKTRRYGHYIILSAYLKSFAKFYEHLKCRDCGKLMKPLQISNYAFRALTQFQCADENCTGNKEIVYLNHCFNKQRCNATIDSRDSKQCPNEQYICPECGACCSTENFRRRISHLQTTGGDISQGIIRFVQEDKGHWEKNEFFCYKCGKKITEKKCEECNVKYK